MTRHRNDSAAEIATRVRPVVELLDELAGEVRRGAEEASAREERGIFDDPEYHALAAGFHRARQRWLQGGPAGRLHAMPGVGTARTAAPRLALRSLRLAALALALVGGGLLLAGLFGGGSDRGGSEAIGTGAPGAYRGGAALQLDVQCGTRSSLVLRWDARGAPWRAANRITVRIYPTGALDPVLELRGLAGQTRVIGPENLKRLERDQSYEAEVELETPAGLGPASGRVPFRLQP